MEKKAGEDEIAAEQPEMAAPAGAGAPAATRKRKRAATDDAAPAASGLCEDVVGNILARLPARTAVACLALSKHHRSLIRSPEFGGLHCRLGAPLPRPHIAYLATAPITRRKRPGTEEEEEGEPAVVSAFHGFHVAGGGAAAGTGNAPMRTLVGSRYLGMGYVNTCNGVVLLAREKFSAACRCVLWNPATADAVREVTVPDPSQESDDGRKYLYRILGLGYGRRSKAYKLVIFRQDHRFYRHQDDHGRSFVIQTLGGAAEERPAAVLSAGRARDKKLGQSALHVDGTVYRVVVKHGDPSILAFDLDDATLTCIRMPAEGRSGRCHLNYSHELLELSGRPCVAMEHGRGVALWLLTADHRLERMCVINYSISANPIIGVWDCGGVLVLFSEQCAGTNEIAVYNVATEKMMKGTLPCDLAPDTADYKVCWGYRPTLVSPGSILGELINQGVERRRPERPGDAMKKILKPVVERDRKKGRKATMDILCFMEFLVSIMQKLPDDVQSLVEMPAVDSDDPAGFFFQNVVCKDEGS